MFNEWVNRRSKAVKKHPLKESKEEVTLIRNVH
jgi:hypothetical protein